MSGQNKRPRGRLGRYLSRLNHTVTEVGIEHFDDDLDWDARVKLPEWQLARLKARHLERASRNRLRPPEDV